MPPSNNFGRLAQYVRGSSEPEPNGQTNSPRAVPRQQRDDMATMATSTAYYPPASNPTTRLAIAEAAKMPLPKPSPQRASGPGPGPGSHLRQPSNAGMPPLGTPPSLALPNPQHAPSTRRRSSNSTEKAPGIWSPSLPSNLATPFDSPKSMAAEPRIDRQYSTRHGHGSMSQPMRTAGDVYRGSATPPPLVRGVDDHLDVPQARYGPSAGTYQGLHNHRPTGSTWQQNGAFPTNETVGFLSSPKRHPAKLAIHDPNHRRSYAVGNEEPAGRQVNGRASSPTLNRFSRGFSPFEEPPRAAQRTVNLRRDVALEGDFRSDYPASDNKGDDDDNNDDDDEEDDRGTPRARIRRDRTREADGFLDSSPRRRLPTESISLADKIAQSIKKRTRDSCDYEDQALMQMSYSELKDQPFDVNPAQVVPDGAAAANGASGGESLPEKLAHYRNKGAEEQAQLFTQMSLQDWERSGDWFLEQFGAVAQKLKEARQKKRAMVQSFEDEIAAREEAVRLRTENINKRLGEIKHKGEDMLAGKDI